MALRIVKAGQKSSVGYLKQAKYGKTGSGKSLTALLEAEGLAKLDKKRRGVLVLDTENGYKWYRLAVPERTVHPEAFAFDIVSTRSMSDVIEAMETLAGDYCVFIVDSITHLWETAQAAYTGKKTSAGTLPIQAWASIKRPYKAMMQRAMDGEFHVTINGREGVVIDDSTDGEFRVVGARMKAEGETQYEPDILWRMVPERAKDGDHIIRSFCEKDRSGILSGKTFDWPNYETIAPLVRYIGGDQPKLDDADAAAERDSAAAEAQETRKKNEAADLHDQIKSAILGAVTIDQLKAAWSLTSGKKGRLGDENYTNLEAIKDERKSQLLGRVA